MPQKTKTIKAWALMDSKGKIMTFENGYWYFIATKFPKKKQIFKPIKIKLLK